MMMMMMQDSSALSDPAFPFSLSLSVSLSRIHCPTHEACSRQGKSERKDPKGDPKRMSRCFAFIPFSSLFSLDSPSLPPTHADVNLIPLGKACLSIFHPLVPCIRSPCVSPICYSHSLPSSGCTTDALVWLDRQPKDSSSSSLHLKLR